MNLDFRTIVDSAPALIFSARPDGYIDYLNQRWLDLIGAPLDAIQGWQWAELIHTDDRVEHLDRWRKSNRELFKKNAAAAGRAIKELAKTPL